MYYFLSILLIHPFRKLNARNVKNKSISEIEKLFEYAYHLPINR